MSIKKFFKDCDFTLREERFGYIFSLSGLNQAEFSKVTGMSQGSISNILNGLKWISKPSAILIERMYGINQNWLLTGEGEMYVGGGKAGEGEFSQKRIDEKYFISYNKGPKKLEEEIEMWKDKYIALQEKILAQQEENYKLKLENIELRQKNNPGESPAKQMAG